MRDPHTSRRKGRPTVIKRTRIRQSHHIAIRFTELLANKSQAEQRTIPDRELREVIGLTHLRIQELRNNALAHLTIPELERLLAYFQCSLDDLVHVLDAPAHDEP
jgi:DNA-binding Xre family transcriptional regulator